MHDVTNPGPEDFWLVPLGGTGEIGMNLNLYGHDGHWIMVDCGISFFDQLDSNGFVQSEVIMPDISFVKKIKDKLLGLVVTHAHEDHLGAIPYLWSGFSCPIYCTSFTRHVLINKLVRHHCPAPVFGIDPKRPLNLGSFSLHPVTMTHSTPETYGFVIETPAARVFHTADWKLDPDPVIGVPATETIYRDLGPLDAIVTDSTNVLEPSAAISEAKVYEGLLAIIQDAPGRVIVSCFASNVARLQTLSKIAKQTGRYLGLTGASLELMRNAAERAGYLEEFETHPCDELAYLPPQEVLIIATGSQGQPGSALHRLALNTHPDINLSELDQVILSSKTIPGNEKSISRLLELFEEQDIRVSQGDTSNLPLHASGHGGKPEIEQLLLWTKPKIVVPVHGEARHLEASADLANHLGFQSLLGRNGDLFDLTNGSKLSHAVPAGVLTLDNLGNLVALDRDR